MYVVFAFLMVILMMQSVYLWKYQRQVKDICRQLSFILKHDSNMLVTSDLRGRGIGGLVDLLNEELEYRRDMKRKYEKKERVISAMYTNLSHDIRTPMTSLDGYFQMAGDSDDPAEQKRFFSIIQERISSLKEMLEEIFMFAKITDDSYRIHLEKCCVNQILKDTVFSYYDEWIQRGIEPELLITEELLYVEGSPQGIRRVLQNIIKNGLDHGNRRIKITLELAGDTVCLKIRNKVAASDQIDADKVFDRFYKGDIARSKNSTGLGLSIAKELMLHMHGEIAAEVVGDEFCVKISFPVYYLN